MAEQGSEAILREAGPFPSAAPGASREGWIDVLRVGLTALVVLHHAAIAHGAAGSWFLRVVPEDRPALSLLAAVDQAFFMGLFFFLAGYLAPRSFARKGLGSFLDRALRLGLPVLAFGFALGPLTVRLAHAAPAAILADWLARLAQGQFVLGPGWFPLALLLLSLAVPPLRPAPASAPLPRPWVWAAAALGVGMASLATRQLVPVGEEILGLQLGYFASHLLPFRLGVRASRPRWPERIRAREAGPWLALSLLAIPVLPAVLLSSADPRYGTGLSLSAVTYAFWEPLVASGA